MHDVLLGVTVILVFAVMYLSTPSTRKATLMFAGTGIEEIKSDTECQKYGGFYSHNKRLLIEEDILSCITDSNSTDARERVVALLRELSEYTDTSEFLETNPNIHRCIFFMDT